MAEDISGKVIVKPTKGKKLDHQGIRIELLGHIGIPFFNIILNICYQIEIPHDKHLSCDFVQISRELEPPGSLFDDKQYEFSFSKGFSFF